MTDAVHAKGGRIVAQIWHVGRISHTSLLPQGEQPVWRPRDRPHQDVHARPASTRSPQPRALTTAEVGRVVDQFRQAARNAIDAGFDGVEVHGANGYLVEQFLRDSCNDRTDQYGGSIENRARFLIEVMTAVCAEIGPGRVGLRLSPVTPANDIGQDSDPFALFSHVVRNSPSSASPSSRCVEGSTAARATSRRSTSPRSASCGPTPGSSTTATPARWRCRGRVGAADAVSFGKAPSPTPTWPPPARGRAGADNPKTLYGGGAEGYTDYPALPD